MTTESDAQPISAKPDYLGMLIELGRDWNVSLISEPARGWVLTVTSLQSGRGWIYTGELERTIHRAWAGERGDLRTTVTR